MSEERVPAGRMASAGRRIAGTPGWPPAAAALLGSLATTELVLRAGGSGTEVSVALLLGLGATVPVALAHTHLPRSRPRQSRRRHC